MKLHLCGALWATVLAGAALANVPPNTPTITEPVMDGLVLNPEDVHMETAPFSDPDPGDTHSCTDWEIWLVAPSERVWFASCVAGVERVHIHLGDGVFQNSHAGRVSLLAGTAYQLRVRHRDSSGDAPTQWSAFSTRLFSTGQLSTVFPMELDDVASSPVPTLQDTGGGGASVALPGAGPSAGFVRLASPAGELLLEVRGGGGAGNQISNPSAIAAHAPVKVAIQSSLAQAMTLPETNLIFVDDTGVDRSVYLPAVTLGAGQAAYYWVAGSGATYVGTAMQTQPVFTQLARSAPVPWRVAQPGYRVEVVATGFQLPVNIAFVPNPGQAPTDPLYYVTELYGNIKVVLRNGTVETYASGLLNFNPTGDFPGSGEQGVTGICVDPVSGDVFAGMLYDSAPPNGAHYPKVVRFHSNDGGHTAATQTIIRNMTGESQGQSHQISNFSIGPDGKLYVHMGDGFNTGTAQNLDSYRGKILRMNLDGTAPTDNPFYNAANGINARDYVFAYGVRNPFGGAWRASDGRHYEVENGPSVDRFAQVIAGRNFLWDGSDASMANFALYNWNPAHAPVNIAYIQPSTIGASLFPAADFDHAFVTESGPTWGTGPQTNGKRIVEFAQDAAGNVTSGPTTLIEYIGSGKASASGLAAGPDGLYFTDLYKDEGYVEPIDPGANVLRIKYVGVADFTANVTMGTAPLNVQFTDTSVAPLPIGSWLWDFGDGTTSTAQSPSHAYSVDGIYNVRLSVNAANGPIVVQKNGYIRVGQPPAIAMIGGTAAPSATDLAIENRLRSSGFVVDHYDDEPANRPAASALATNYGLVIVSSSCTSGNIAGEFRTVNVPLIFWESALLTSAREGLTSAGTTVGTQTTIDIVTNAHPITAGMTVGPFAAFSTASTMSVGNGTVPAGTVVLALRGGSATDVALMAAEQGAVLVGGYIAPARRVFMFFDDTSFNNAPTASRQILDRAVCWAMRATPTITAQPAPETAPPGTLAQFEVTVAAAGPLTYQWRRNTTPLGNGGNISGANTRTLTINPVGAGDAGTYDVIVNGICGSVTSDGAALFIGCPADFNMSGSVTAQDIFDFLAAFFANTPSADFNNSGAITAQDIFDFLAAFFSPCP